MEKKPEDNVLLNDLLRSFEEVGIVSFPHALLMIAAIMGEHEPGTSFNDEQIEALIYYVENARFLGKHRKRAAVELS